jgi:hypothetical protein
MEYDLLLVTFSDGSIMVGQKYNTAFTSWVFRINEQKSLDIVDTLLTNNEELTKILNKNKSII